MYLILFDIDGTLINSSRAGRAAMGRALHEVFGTAGAVHSYNFAGKTDRRIVHDLMTAEGWAAAEVEARLPDFYERMTAAGRELFTPERIRPCPGVLSLLDALGRRDDVVMALLTGNIHHTVPLKLGAAGIDPALFRVGAYGSDGIERDELFGLALERAHGALRWRFQPRDVIVIGDTPADIRCARAGGGRAIAVATGPYAPDVLSECRPDHLFLDLARTEAVMLAILNPAAQPCTQPCTQPC
jgi:phosphoglycolate phosphatase-like HAD superfamily hydrolase